MGRRRWRGGERHAHSRTRDGNDRILSDNHMGVEISELSQRVIGFGIESSAEIIASTNEYIQLLLRWNRRVALLSRRDEVNIVRKHIAISLSPMLLRIPSPDEKWVDVGTGAGLPGLILRIWNSSMRLTLIESSRKKCMFLEEAVRGLDLGGVEICCARVETLLARGQSVGAYDVMLVRAVADLTTTLREFGPLVRPGGEIITFKGPTWPEEVDHARSTGYLGAGAYDLRQLVKIPWCQGHLLSIRC